MSFPSQSEFNKLRMTVFPKNYWSNRDDPNEYPYRKRHDGSFDFGDFNSEW